MRRQTTIRAAAWLAVLGCAGPSPQASPPAVRTAEGIRGSTPDAAAPPAVSSSPTALRDDQRARARALATHAEPFYAAYSNYAPVLSADGSKVFFFSARSGVARLYGADVARPTAAAWPVGDGAGRPQWVASTRDGRSVVYMQDLELFRALPDGTHATSLTPGEHVPRYLAPLPRDRPDTLLYSKLANDPPSSALYAVDISTGAARLLRTDSGEVAVADVTADASRALQLRVLGDLEQGVFEVLTKEGAPRRIFPSPEAKARVSAVAYSAEGRRAFVATDEGGETMSILAINLATGSVDARYRAEDPTTASMRELAVSPKGDLVAVGFDLGSRNEVRILDARTLKVARTVVTPPGTAYPTAFTRDGKSFGLYLATPERPGDAYRVDAQTGKIEPLRSEPRPATTGVAAQIVAIPSFDGQPLPTNVYLPSGAATSKLATLVFLHGGPDDSARLGWRPRYAFLASLGFAVVEPNVRGSTGFGRAFVLADHREKRGDAIRDVEAVNRWARAQPWCDPSRIALSGHSYGGYLTLLALAEQPALWRAGAVLAASVDQARFLRSLPPDMRARAAADFGDPDGEPELVARYSPIRSLYAIQAPVFVWQGEKDPVVHTVEPESLVAALRARGIPVEYMLAPGERHVPSSTAAEVELASRMARFFEEQGLTGAVAAR